MAAGTGRAHVQGASSPFIGKGGGVEGPGNAAHHLGEADLV